MDKILYQLQHNGTFRAIDVQAGLFLHRLSGKDTRTVLPLATAFASKAVAEGHVCLPLNQLTQSINRLKLFPQTTPAKIKAALMATAVVGTPEAAAPLILDGHGNLYLHRYLLYENTITHHLQQRCHPVDQVDLNKAQQTIQTLFPATQPNTAPDWQCAAVVLSLIKHLLVVSGGPGTGKTYTAARILAAQAALHPGSTRISLAAPTGKAAARLKESLLQAKKSLPQHLAVNFPEEALTLHRLLRYHHHSGRFLHNKHNQLHLDLLLIDEASMIDIPLMAAVLDALPPTCRLILFGDKDQLASVEAGNLFADICGPKTPAWSEEIKQLLVAITGQTHKASSMATPMDDCLVQLQQSHRFDASSGIGTLASAINRQNTTIIDRCCTAEYGDLDIQLVEQQDSDTQAPHLQQFVLRHFSPLFTAQTPEDALAHFNHARILCALHKGKQGVETLNYEVESILYQHKCITPEGGDYAGRPVMILKNDYALGLFNGDTGILWPDSTGELYGWFPQPDGTLRNFSRLRLPQHQTGYAITIHKSQGSEFDNVLLVLPNVDTPLLTKEMLYTGITRARKSLTIQTNLELLKVAVLRPAIRFSGLHKKLHHP